jgi:hypothetical protein
VLRYSLSGISLAPLEDMLVRVNRTLKRNITLLRGAGNGAFRPSVTYTVGSGPQYITTGDINNDGNVDLVAANSGSNTVSVVPGTGAGTFEPALDYNVGNDPYGIAVGDFNGDGIPTLRIAGRRARHPARLRHDPVNGTVGLCRAAECRSRAPDPAGWIHD